MDKNLVALMAIFLLIIVVSGFGYKESQIQKQKDLILAQQQAAEQELLREEEERLKQEEERLIEVIRQKELADTETLELELQLFYSRSDSPSPSHDDWCELQDFCVYPFFENETFETYETCPIKDEHYRYSESNEYTVSFSFDIPKVYLEEDDRLCLRGAGEKDAEGLYPCGWTVVFEGVKKTNGYVLEDRPFSVCIHLR